MRRGVATSFPLRMTGYARPNPVTTLDFIIAGLVALLAVFGWRRGFLAGALSLVGFVVGAALGTRVGPLLLPEGSASPYAPLFGLMGTLVAGVLLARGLEGVGRQLRHAIRIPFAGTLDGVLGAVLTGLLALGVAWVFGAVALHTPELSGLRRDAQRSVILRELNATFPPSGALLNSLARLDPLPSLTAPDAELAPPREAIARDPEVRAARGSVVKVLGTACGLGVVGSGWVAAQEIVITNAHVVAGQDDTHVLVDGRAPDLPAEVVGLDVRNDLAALQVPGLQAPSLRRTERPRTGRAVAIAGYPLNGGFDIRAGRIGRTETIETQDAYDRGPISRRITTLRATVRHGNSGGPVLDGDGAVVGTVFAASASGDQSGFAVPNAFVDRLITQIDQPISSGPCAP